MSLKNPTRRKFLATTGVAAAGMTVLKPKIVKGSTANSKIKLGLIGCGGRGTWIAKLFQENGNYEITAAADYFQDKVDSFGEQLGVPENKRFTGLSGYKRLIESGVDAIAIISPPYFHPEQAAAGVAAGKHVYVAKPIAVDVPGCKSIEESGKAASANQQVFLVDFQTRTNEFFVEALNKVHSGAIGDFAFGESSYHAGSPWKSKQQFLDADPNNAENRLRGWGMDIALSGDIITEQNIHTLDVMSWIMNEPPIYAMGTCGHKVRTDKGDCADHFALVYQYSNGVGVTFSSRQFEGYDSPDGIKNRMFGSKGVLETEYGGNVMIRGENYYRGGRTNAIYKEGAEANIASFYDSIVKGNYSNPTVEPSVRSNLVTILGRTAAYSGEQVFWYQLLKNNEKLVPNLKGLKE